MIDTTTTGLLTIRAWCEEGSEAPLRAQIRVTKDVSSGFQSTLTVAHQEKVVDAVRGFLEDVLRSSAKES
jgi:hypothetical protein